MKDAEKILDEVMRTQTASRKSMLREVHAELLRLRAERDAARAALLIGQPPGGATLAILMTPTDRVTTVDGVPVRIWEGRTDQGIACVVLVHRIAVDEAADGSAFDAALRGVAPPEKPPDLT